MNRKERLILIEKFRKGQLEGLELKRFEVLLETDEAFRSDLALDQEMNEALNERSDYNLFQKLVQEAEDDYFGVKSKSTSFSWLKIAASFVLIATAALLIWNLTGKDSPDRIYSKAFTPYEAPTNFRGDDISGMDEDFMLGLVKYDEGNYDEAISLFLNTLEKDSINYTARFLTAVSYMAIKDFDLAEPILNDMAKDPSHLFQDQVRWYLGLLYLSDDDETNDQLSENHFSTISNLDLLKRIKKLK